MSKNYRELWRELVSPHIKKKNHKAAKQAADLVIVHVIYTLGLKNLAYAFYKLSK